MEQYKIHLNSPNVNEQLNFRVSTHISPLVQFTILHRAGEDEHQEEKRYQTHKSALDTGGCERADMTTITNDDRVALERKEEAVIIVKTRRESDFRFHMASNVNR